MRVMGKTGADDYKDFAPDGAFGRPQTLVPRKRKSIYLYSEDKNKNEDQQP